MAKSKKTRTTKALPEPTPTVDPVEVAAAEAAEAAIEGAAFRAAATAAPEAKRGVAKKDGLRTPQVRVLKALSLGKALTRKQISESGQVDSAGLTEWLGSLDETKRLANDVKHWPSLISLGLVRAELLDVEGKDTVVYTITAKGKKALAAAEKAAKSE